MDIHASEFFEYVRPEGRDDIPAADAKRIDVAILDMNHAWPNVGHDSLVHAVMEAAAAHRDRLAAAGRKVRVISYDVRRKMLIPDSPNGRFQLYVGTGGPGHLDPRENDGLKPTSQGIAESPAWESPLFWLFDDILSHPDAALVAVCHSFGLLCRWSHAARPVLRASTSSGMPVNSLSVEALKHPWFSQFGAQLADGRNFRVVDNRLFDLILERREGKVSPIAFEAVDSPALTMVELARDAGGEMPRVFGMNYHPEIIDREHIMTVLEEKHARGEVTDQWYFERAGTMRDLFRGENERQSRLTSEFSLLGPLRFHVGRLI
jgi:hypothetical protein